MHEAIYMNNSHMQGVISLLYPATYTPKLYGPKSSAFGLILPVLVRSRQGYAEASSQ